MLNLWRKRWFQLDMSAQRMYYYKTKSKEELLGYINLAEGTFNLPMRFFSHQPHGRLRRHLAADELTLHFLPHLDLR